VCNCVFSQLNTRFAAHENSISTDVWVTLASTDLDSIRTTGSDSVSPQAWSTLGWLIISNYTDAIIVCFVDHIIYAAWLVV
jgi:hypothetical protein